MPSITRRGARSVGRPSAEQRILATTKRLLDEGARFTELGLQRIAADQAENQEAYRKREQCGDQRHGELHRA